jgi:hypothetical protein
MYDIFLCICFRTGALEKREQLLPNMFNPLLIEVALNTINLTLLMNGALLMDKLQIPI